jgi:DNA (cytosine-5)-methyltransferase 1
MPEIKNQHEKSHTRDAKTSPSLNKKNKKYSLTSNKRNLPNRIPVLSFFTGAGLLDLGFMNNGFEVIWRNEFNTAFARGFEHAMSVHTGCDSHKINNTDSIEKLTAEKIIEEAFGNEPVPATFGIIGGPPCTDFSVAGKNHGGEGVNGKLAGIYVNLILKIKPTFFVLENVKGLFDTRKHKKFLDKLVQELEAIYFTDSKVLNALEYGVPQNRVREEYKFRSRNL